GPARIRRRPGGGPAAERPAPGGRPPLPRRRLPGPGRGADPRRRGGAGGRGPPQGGSDRAVRPPTEDKGEMVWSSLCCARGGCGTIAAPDCPHPRSRRMTSPRFILTLTASLILATAAAADPLPGTQPLTMEGDLAAQMVTGIDKYLTRETAASVEKR